jgi:hypothetical protein
MINATLATLIAEAVTNLVEDLLGDDETTAPWASLDEIAKDIGCATYAVIQEARKQGLTVGERGVPRKVRTISSNSHDRWSGPGSCATHGGSGYEQIAGFAGEEV